MSDFEEFCTTLDEIKAVKAPGISGSRIKLLTNFAKSNPDVCINVLYS